MSRGNVSGSCKPITWVTKKIWRSALKSSKHPDRGGSHGAKAKNWCIWMCGCSRLLQHQCGIIKNGSKQTPNIVIWGYDVENKTRTILCGLQVHFYFFHWSRPNSLEPLTISRLHLQLFQAHLHILPPLAGWRSDGWRGSRRGQTSSDWACRIIINKLSKWIRRKRKQTHTDTLKKLKPTGSESSRSSEAEGGSCKQRKSNGKATEKQRKSNGRWPQPCATVGDTEAARDEGFECSKLRTLRSLTAQGDRDSREKTRAVPTHH